jgi:cell division protease FtsH
MVLLGTLALLYYLNKFPWQGDVEEISLDEFKALLQKGQIQSLVIRETNFVGEYIPGVKAKTPRFKLSVPQDLVAKYADQATERGVRVEDKPPNPFLKAILFYVFILGMLLLLFYLLFVRQMRSAGGGSVLSFGKSRARLVTKERTKVTFNDVAGIEEAKDEVKEIIEFLKNPGKFRKLGGRIPRGVLLIGPPGTGKTLLAKAIAGEAGVPFFSISGSDFVEMFVGVGASRVRDLFRQARENSPCLIFLDEIDAVGRSRGHGWGGGHDEREQTLNAILVEMDGFESDENVIVIAATNRPDILDPALRRPGRFDREVMVDLPDLKGREAILQVHARKVKMAPEVKLAEIARGTPMFSGADLEAVINESALRAALKDKAAVDMDDLWESRDRVLWGRQKQSRVMDEEDKKITAFHESGHALVAKILPEVEPLHKVTIIPRGMALGATMRLPEKDVYHRQKKNIMGNIMVLFAGRIAEEMFCGDISSGARSDIQEATELARRMVREWGMSEEIGPISYAKSEERLYGGEVLLSKEYSEATAIKIDQEVKRIADQCFRKTKEILQSHRENVERIAQALLKYEVLDGEEVDKILAGEEIRKETSPLPEEEKQPSPAAEKVTKRPLEKKGKIAEGPAPAI